MVMSSECVRNWREVAMAYFKALFQPLPGQTEKKLLKILIRPG
jgi:hypothetical protein